MALNEVYIKDAVIFLPFGEEYRNLDFNDLSPKRNHNATPGTRFVVTEYEEGLFGKKVNPKASLNTCSPAELLEAAREFYRRLDFIAVPSVAFFEQELFGKKIEGQSLWSKITEGLWPEVKDICIKLSEGKEGIDESLFYSCEELSKKIKEGSFPSHEEPFYSLGRFVAQLHDSGIDIGYIADGKYENERMLEHYIEDLSGTLWLVDVDPQTTRFLSHMPIDDRIQYIEKSISNFEKSGILWKPSERKAYAEGYLEGTNAPKKDKASLKKKLEPLFFE